MNTVHRRTEIINILIIRRHTTANELAQEFGVSIRTIQYDIQALTPVYPIYTKQGENGGIFIREDYKPYANSLTPMEVAALHELYDWTLPLQILLSFTQHQIPHHAVVPRRCIKAFQHFCQIFLLFFRYFLYFIIDLITTVR